ncbi:MAG: PfkB family carbohydrate kinase, partial [Pseudoflavonifractor sp.]
AVLRGELTAAGVDATRVITDPTTATGHAIIQVDKLGQNCILLYGGANLTITEADADRALEGFGRGDWLFLQNEISCLTYLIRRGAELGMTIVLNPSPINETLIACDLSCVSWFILNEIEGTGMTGCHDAKSICTSLHCRYPNANFVLTLGSRGAICTDPSGFVWQPIFPVETVDSTAAGDTFTGYFFSAVYQGMSHSEALRRGAMASALSVSRSGSAISIPTREQVETALAQLKGNDQAQSRF